MRRILIFPAFLVSFVAGSIAIPPSIIANGTGAGNCAFSGDGSVLVLAAPYYDDSRGAAYIYGCVGGTCGSAQLVMAEDAVPGDLLSVSLALSGDGRTLALGAPGRSNGGDTNVGAIYLAACNDGHCGTLILLQSPSLQPGGTFGSSAALNFDGTVLAVGAEGINSDAGAVYVYACVGGLCNPAPHTIPAPGGFEVPLLFGKAVALDAAGALLAVGAPRECCGPANVNNTGRVFMFSCSAGVCGPPVVYPVAGEPFDYFGNSVALNEDGSFLLISSQGRNGGAGLLFGGSCFTNASCVNRGQIYPSGLVANDAFGTSLSVSGGGSVLLVGAPNRGGAGAAFLFRCDSLFGICDSFAATELLASDATQGASFGGGLSVAGDASWLVVGAAGEAYISNISRVPSPSSTPLPVSATASPSPGLCHSASCPSGVCAPRNGNCCLSPSAAHELDCDALGYVTACLPMYTPTSDRLTCALESGEPCFGPGDCASGTCSGGFCCAGYGMGCASCRAGDGACSSCFNG
jgi:hypothetical protein